MASSVGLITNTAEGVADGDRRQRSLFHWLHLLIQAIWGGQTTANYGKGTQQLHNSSIPLTTQISNSHTWILHYITYITVLVCLMCVLFYFIALTKTASCTYATLCQNGMVSPCIIPQSPKPRLVLHLGAMCAHAHCAPPARYSRERTSSAPPLLLPWACFHRKPVGAISCITSFYNSLQPILIQTPRRNVKQLAEFLVLFFLCSLALCTFLASQKQYYYQL